uniref:FHA domain-containing protein n=1 Tax=uncultured marine bacterium MedDCM-OCT-S01-C143 TaxID=743046 RepID=D6PCD1_9BACT|nr:hypothetical protein [uncultured marine bacterium MedDCM-OCT-S01-C143]
MGIAFSVLEVTATGRDPIRCIVDRAIFSVGSNPECDLCLQGKDIAGVQFVLKRQTGGDIVLENCAPTGTRVAGREVKKAFSLENEHIIQFEAVSLRFLFVESSDEESARNTLTLRDLGRKPSAQWVAHFENKKYSITQEGLRIGCGPENELRLSDPWVSGAHATLRIEGDRCFVLDRDSRNGVFWDSKR